MRRLFSLGLIVSAFVTMNAFADRTHKQEEQVTAATAQQEVTLTGTLKTGLVAIGGETTGVVIVLADGKTVELSFSSKAFAKVQKLNGQQIKVSGKTVSRCGPERGCRTIIEVKRYQ